MQKKERIVRYSDKKLRAMKSRTDWARVKSTSQAEVERLADEEDGALPKDWESGIVLGLPPGKEAIKLRIDRDVLDWFRATGQGYQTRINNVLRAFVTSRRETNPAPRSR
jgi:uncharacterized protein (DUF4415 family)